METDDIQTLQAALTVRNLVYGPEDRFCDEKFTFSPEVNRLKIDIGLSNEGVYGCEWLLGREDVGVIGIEPNPLCHRNLLYAGSRNSYIPCLCLEFNSICRFAGFVSEVYVKQALAVELAKEGKKTQKSLHEMLLPHDFKYVDDSGTTFRIIPIQIKAGHAFRVQPVVQELRDIKGKYILVGAAVDKIESEEEIIYQNFYSTSKDLGTSSLRKEVVEDSPEKGDFQEVQVPSLSLDSILKHIDWDRFSFIECIKIDVEGKELDVLRSCKKYIEKVVYFRIEAFECVDPDNPPATTAEDIVHFMKERGFELFDDEPGDYKFVNTRYKKLIEKHHSNNPLSW